MEVLQDITETQQLIDSLKNEQNVEHKIYKTPRAKQKPRSRASSGNIIPTETSIKECIFPKALALSKENEEFWQQILHKEEASASLRRFEIFDEASPRLSKRRMLLLDWIMEVSQAFRLRRTTYYLAVDYIDRYLSIDPFIPKGKLQLLGIVSLFIAAKLDEVELPQLPNYEDVCDGACETGEILTFELILLRLLKWDVNPCTPISWLNLYLQMNADRGGTFVELTSNTFQYPQYSAWQFVQAANIIDLFSMDASFMRFKYSSIAAAAVFFVRGKATALSVSGHTWESLRLVVQEMAIYARVIKDAADPRFQQIIPYQNDKRLDNTYLSIRRSVPNVVSNENHCLQTNISFLDHYERAVLLRIKAHGLEIVKVYIKIVVLSSGRRCYVSSYAECADEDVVVNYEVSLGDSPDEVPVLASMRKNYDSGTVDVLKLVRKTIVSFDDLLTSLNAHIAKVNVIL